MGHDQLPAVMHVLEKELKIAEHYNEFPLATPKEINKSLQKMGMTQSYTAAKFARIIKDELDKAKTLDEATAFKRKLKDFVSIDEPNNPLPTQPDIKRHVHVHLKGVARADIPVELQNVDDETDAY